MAFLTKEVPTGAIDGVNKIFTLSNIIVEIDDVFVDGAIYLGIVIVTPGTGIFELADAPTTTIYVDYWDTPPIAPAPIGEDVIGLQKPQIIELTGYNLRIAHPDQSDEVGTTVADYFTASGTTLTVLDNNNMVDQKYVLIGEIGDNQTEEVQIDGAVTPGTSLTIVNTTKFNHELHAPVQKIVERGIKVYGTNTGPGTLLESVASIATPIASAVAIQWDKPFTEYQISVTDTVYKYYFVTFFDGDFTESAPSDLIPADGFCREALSSIIRGSLDATDTQLDNNKYTWQMMVRWANLWQDAVVQFAYASPSGRMNKKDWAFELDDTSNYTPILVAQNENKYDLSNLKLKYKNSNKAIVDIQIGDNCELQYLPVNEFRNLFLNKHFAVASAASIGDTTLGANNTSSFNAKGSINVGSMVITYTGKTLTSFTGIPASGQGSITSAITAGQSIWQNLQQGKPNLYTIIDSFLYLNLPIPETMVGQQVKANFYKCIPSLTSASDSTLITFFNTAELFLNSKIEQRRANLDKAKDYMSQFMAQMVIEAQNDSIPVAQGYKYWEYKDYGLSYDNIRISTSETT